MTTAGTPRDPALYLSTFPEWNRQAFLDAVARGPGALAGFQVDWPHAGPRGEAILAAIGAEVIRRWPALAGALAAWPGAAAQRSGWADLWACVPDGDPDAVLAALASAFGPRVEPALEGRLVVVAIDGVGTAAAQAAIRAAEDELHRWQHGQSAVERRWVDATGAGP